MINVDISQAVHMQGSAMDWQMSPSQTISRKRFHLNGATESGQVTSLVKYEPGAQFPRHEHPGGEEILVLSGVFSDEQGDWQAGTYLLNPEGFAHAPYSREGCELFVKLRQYPGDDHLALPLASLEAVEEGGVKQRLLHTSEGVSTSIVELPAAETLAQTYIGGCEGFVLEGAGALHIGEATWLLSSHDWFRSPPGHSIRLESAGIRLYLKENGVAQLWEMA